MKTGFFEDSMGGVSGMTILLDVDGTLVPDGERVVPENVCGIVEKLKGTNTVYLVSNGTDVTRVEAIAGMLGVFVAPAGAPAGKPSRDAIRGIPTDKPFVVVGDKLVTDGFLARNIHARFIHTRSKFSGREGLTVRFSYMLEHVLSWFL